MAAQHTGNVATLVSRDDADKTSVRVALRAVKLKTLPPRLTARAVAGALRA